MKWKDRAAEVKPFKEIMSRLGMVRYRLLFRYMRRGLTIIRVWLELVKLKNRTLVIWNTTCVWQWNQGMHISVIRSYLVLNLVIYPLLIASPDMISFKSLTSPALSIHFMINYHYLTLSPIRSWIYFFEGGINYQGHYRMWEKQTTNICSPKKQTLQTFVVLKSGHYKTFVVSKSNHYKHL